MLYSACTVCTNAVDIAFESMQCPLLTSAGRIPFAPPCMSEHLYIPCFHQPVLCPCNHMSPMPAVAGQALHPRVVLQSRCHQRKSTMLSECNCGACLLCHVSLAAGVPRLPVPLGVVISHGGQNWDAPSREALLQVCCPFLSPCVWQS